jgi:hypothetical protein
MMAASYALVAGLAIGFMSGFVLAVWGFAKIDRDRCRLGELWECDGKIYKAVRVEVSE